MERPRQPRHARRRIRAGGFTLLETCLLISGLGVLLAMAIPTFVATLRTSKTAEAGEHLARMVAGASSYYLSFHETENGRRTQCLPEPAGPVPALPGPEPVSVRFDAELTGGSPTWTALGFSPPHPVRYSYVFAPSQSGCGLGLSDQEVRVQFVAQGDLDGDGKLSEFRRTAVAGRQGLEVDPLLMVDHRVE